MTSVKRHELISLLVIRGRVRETKLLAKGFRDVPEEERQRNRDALIDDYCGALSLEERY